MKTKLPQLQNRQVYNMCSTPAAVGIVFAAGINFALSFPKVKTVFVRDPNLPLPSHDEDLDVAQEASRVLEGKTANEMLVLKNLKKLYTGNEIAVHEDSFSLPKGECFGYLGINGAGKTTTMKIPST
ncbi:hypothetical protein Ae201684_003598 [Aphanomyces euteiches]|uniref:ABC transporter domain-containing protein n=1 Tax=Aphanomyces euteiches TaxID=100861 RepID=A0A6G0XLC9_9STRA|nr:hypothetical protein Ae201684_003598 [Aphanomyces euteiches]